MAQSDIKLKIGAKLPRKYADESDAYMATTPNNFLPFIEKTVANVNYSIAFEEESRKIRFIHTIDKDFRTKNGLHVGSRISVTRSQLTIYPSWYTFAPETPDGWLPIVSESEETLEKLKDGETKIVFVGGFIKRG